MLTVHPLSCTVSNKEPENNKKERPIHYATYQGKLDIVKYFMEVAIGIEKEPRDKYGNTPLQLAVKNGKQEVIE